MDFLTLHALSKRFGEFLAVDDLTLSVGKGEFVSLLGPSGCGKTTTLQMIAGLVDPTSGSIGLDGRDITRQKPNMRGLGIVFQSYALFPHMTVAQNVVFGLEMRKIARAERDVRVRDILALVRLSALADRYPRQLSGGQRQRVAIARALVIAPPVLLLDEPLSNLDAKLREEMQFELSRIQRSTGTTTIMVTHDQAEALSISDRVVVMEGGRMTQVDAPYRLYEHPATPFIANFVGKTNHIAAGALPGLPAGTGYTIRPEKIAITTTGAGLVDGTISARFFLGGTWLLQVETVAGTLSVSMPNLGAEPPKVGERVGLGWERTALRPDAGASA